MRRLVAALTLVVFFLVPATSSSAFPSGETVLGAAAAAEGAGIGIRLVDIPANAQDDPRARSYIVDNLPPGTTIERRVEVQNNTSSFQSVRVYPSAARIEDGSFGPDDAAEDNVLTQWTSVDQPTLELAAGESAQVEVTVAVPADAAEGEQYAAVWAEVRSDRDPDSNIINASRVGIRMYVSVGPGNGPAADFSITSLSASRDEAGIPEVTATVTNTGGRALDVSGTLELTGGPSGLAAGPFSTTTATTLAPGDADDVTVALGPDLPRGPWQAELTLQSGLVVHDISAKITFPEVGESADVVANDGAPEGVLIGVLVGIAVILAVGVGVIAWVLRRRGRVSSV